MSLIDRINSVPLKVAGKIVEKAGKSKYSLAQLCNFTAGASSLYATIGAYNKGYNFVAIVGGLFTVMQGIYTFSNPMRKAVEQPDFVEKTAKELLDRIDMDEEEIKEKLELLEYKLTMDDKLEKKSVTAGFFQVLNSVAMGVLAGVTYANVDLDAEFKDYGMYLGLCSVTLFFSGLAHYFRAVPKRG